MTVLFFIVLFFAPTLAHAAEPTIEPKEESSKFFDALRVYSKHDFVLNDVVEFAVFDMSEVSLINDATEILNDATASATVTASADATSSQILNGLAETKAEFTRLPKVFYRNLKDAILTQNVPVTLFSGKVPAYAKALELTVKIKRINIKSTIKENSHYTQPIAVRIFGQITDKKTGEVLIKYYDTAEASFLLGQSKAIEAFDVVAQALMQDLALYLKTKY